MRIALALAASCVLAIFVDAACSGSSSLAPNDLPIGGDGGPGDAAIASPDAAQPLTVDDAGQDAVVGLDVAVDEGIPATDANATTDTGSEEDAGPDAGPCDASCPIEFNCGTIVVCETIVSCGAACSAPNSCVHNSCACTGNIDGCRDGGACLSEDGCGHSLICKNQCELMVNGYGSDAGDAGTPETCDAPGEPTGNASWWRYLDGALYGTVPSQCYALVGVVDEPLCCPPCLGSYGTDPPFFGCPLE